jgi:pyrroline-5-carboxylate reductase
MATALARGFVRSGQASAAGILASDPSPAAREAFSLATGCATTADNARIAAESDCLFLAVKPQHAPHVLRELHGKLTADHLVISIAAGVPLAAISDALGPGPRLVRVMPNTACLVGHGASAFALGPGADEADAQTVDRLLCAVGTAGRVDEKLLEAVTGLSGSGPAFVYLVIEALADGGVLMGLPREVALKLAAQTVRGAAEMVLATGEHPAALKDRVASPGGTTIAGLEVLESAATRSALIGAVRAATSRSVELGKAANRGV